LLVGTWDGMRGIPDMSDVQQAEEDEKKLALGVLEHGNGPGNTALRGYLTHMCGPWRFSFLADGPCDEANIFGRKDDRSKTRRLDKRSTE
jgi:hypothetical protein